MANETLQHNSANLLPPYTLRPLPPLLPFISDAHLLLVLPIIAYWAYGLLFYYIDVYDYLPYYRLHTPAEFLKRNHVPVSEVVTYVLKYQALTTVIGIFMIGEPEMCGMEEYEIAIWAQRIRRLCGETFAVASGLIGINDISMLRATSGPAYPLANWEVSLASYIYYYAIPALQFGAAIFFADTWQYFYHRLVHVSPWLYANLHCVHHKNFVPYAFGAFYSNLLEAFLVDVISTFLAVSVTGLTTRQAMWFVTLSVLKAVDDHCGYAIPWDPFQFITGQNALFHDIHHQGWGIKIWSNSPCERFKTNFSQTYTTFWDYALGTTWKGTESDMAARYARGAEVGKQWAVATGRYVKDAAEGRKSEGVAQSVLA